MNNTADSELSELVSAILANDIAGVSRLLAASPQLSTATFQTGASRQTPGPFFLRQIGRYIYKGDTALHLAAAAHNPELVRILLAAGAVLHAANRLGDQPIHAAAVGRPGSPGWNPDAQSATLTSLIQAGADPNALNKRGVAPLHLAIRTRSALAVQTLLQFGANPDLTNKSGSTPLLLATLNTGRSGSGSPEAKAEQQQILRLLRQQKS